MKKELVSNSLPGKTFYGVCEKDKIMASCLNGDGVDYAAGASVNYDRLVSKERVAEIRAMLGK